MREMILTTERMRHYLLTAAEAEVIACYRLLDAPARNTVIAIITSQVDLKRHKLDNAVKLTLVNKECASFNE